MSSKPDRTKKSHRSRPKLAQRTMGFSIAKPRCRAAIPTLTGWDRRCRKKRRGLNLCYIHQKLHILFQQVHLFEGEPRT